MSKDPHPMSESIEGLVEMARTICDFMDWPEDGPAWDDALKLARQVHEPAYRAGWNDREGDFLCGADRVAPVATEALSGIADDYMTSEHHHPGYVLIPTAKFEELCALSNLTASTAGGGWKLDREAEVWRVCHVIRGECQQCPPSDMVHGDVRGCYAQAVECINTVETGNPWRKTGDVRAPWVALPQHRTSSDGECPDCGGAGRFDCEDEQRSGVCPRCDGSGHAQ
jgi:hypothetical protein